MGIKFGEIDASQILENEFRIGVLEGMIDWIRANNEGRLRLPSPDEFKLMQHSVVERLQKKYPNSGIQIKG